MTTNLLIIAIGATVLLTFVIALLAMRRRRAPTMVVPPPSFEVTPVVSMRSATRLARGSVPPVDQVKRPTGLRPSHAGRSIRT